MSMSQYWRIETGSTTIGFAGPTQRSKSPVAGSKYASVRTMSPVKTPTSRPTPTSIATVLCSSMSHSTDPVRCTKPRSLCASSVSVIGLPGARNGPSNSNDW